MDPLHSIESGPDYENDEVIRELDVYVNDKLELYLLQFPLKPCYIHPPPEFKSAKYKPENRKLELDGGASMPCMVSSTLPNTTQIGNNLGIGVIRDNALHITPLQDILQLRPSFEAFQKNFDFIVDDEDEEDLVNRNKTGSVSNKVAASGSILQQVPF